MRGPTSLRQWWLHSLAAHQHLWEHVSTAVGSNSLLECPKSSTVLMPWSQTSYNLVLSMSPNLCSDCPYRQSSSPLVQRQFLRCPAPPIAGSICSTLFLDSHWKFLLWGFPLSYRSLLPDTRVTFSTVMTGLQASSVNHLFIYSSLLGGFSSCKFHKGEDFTYSFCSLCT